MNLNIKTLVSALLFGIIVFILFPYIFIKLNSVFSLPVIVYKFPSLRFIGIIVGLLGLVVWLYAGNLFRTVGEGTPVPINPPKKLVIKGVYKYSRNPMYIGLFLTLFGCFLYFRYVSLLIYFVIIVIFFHFLVVYYEEPTLKKIFGEEFLEYCKKTPRWV